MVKFLVEECGAAVPLTQSAQSSIGQSVWGFVHSAAVAEYLVQKGLTTAPCVVRHGPEFVDPQFGGGGALGGGTNLPDWYIPCAAYKAVYRKAVLTPPRTPIDIVFQIPRDSMDSWVLIVFLLEHGGDPNAVFACDGIPPVSLLGSMVCDLMYPPIRKALSDPSSIDPKLTTAIGKVLRTVITAGASIFGPTGGELSAIALARKKFPHLACVQEAFDMGERYELERPEREKAATAARMEVQRANAEKFFQLVADRTIRMLQRLDKLSLEAAQFQQLREYLQTELSGLVDVYEGCVEYIEVEIAELVRREVRLYHEDGVVDTGRIERATRNFLLAYLKSVKEATAARSASTNEPSKTDVNADSNFGKEVGGDIAKDVAIGIGKVLLQSFLPIPIPGLF
jgi:hypothetical protein